MRDDAIDEAISAAERTRGTMPPEPDLEMQSTGGASSYSFSNNRRNKTSPATVAIMVLLVIVAGLFAYAAFIAPSSPQDPRDNFRIAAMGLVKQNLRSPATAQFAPPAEWAFEKINDDMWRMRAWVDSENVYSALLRDRFVVIVSRESNDDWRMNYLKLGNSAEAFGKYEFTLDELSQQERERAAAAKAAADEQARDIARGQQIIAERKAAEKLKETEEAAAWQKMRKQLDDVRTRSSDIDAKHAAEINAAKERATVAEAAKIAAERERQEAVERAKYRAWSGSESTIQARIIGLAGNVLTVEQRDGKRLKLELDKLSDADRTFVATWKRDRR